MKNFSASSILNSLNSTLKRFPITIGIVAFALVVSLSIDENAIKNALYIKELAIIFSGFVCIPIMLCIAVICEKYNIKLWINIALKCVGVLIFFLLILAFNHFISNTLFSRFLVTSTILTFCFIILFLVAPFVYKSDALNFWKFFKTTTKRFIIITLSISFIYIGIFIAFLVTKALFKINISDIFILRIWFIFIAIIIISFISGIPHIINNYTIEDNNQNDIRIFAYYIILPLVIIYLSIIYVYIIKILFIHQLPIGWISWLSIGTLSLTLLLFIAVYPRFFYSQKANKYLKFLLFLLIPVLIIFYVAIIKRIYDYGFTVERYYIFLIAIWFTTIITYLIISKIKDLRVVPFTIMLFIIISISGPIGAYNISEKSQIYRLEKLLHKLNILENGKFKNNSKPIDFKELKEIKHLINYLIDNHGIMVFDKYLSVNSEVLNTVDVIKKKELIIELLGINSKQDNTKEINISCKKYYYLKVADFDIVTDKYFFEESAEFSIANYLVSTKIDNSNLIFNINNDTFTINIKEFIINLIGSTTNYKYEFPLEKMTYQLENENFKINVIFTDISYKVSGKIINLQVCFLLKDKSAALKMKNIK